MSANTSIEWADHTFSPWWGCVEVSAACDNCYARVWAKRTGHGVWGKDAPRRFFSDKHWSEPLKWNAQAVKEGAQRRVFCGSMCDVMEDRVDLHGERLRLFPLIEQTKNLDWLLLTKRPQNFRRFLPLSWQTKPLPNVWLMTTVESSEHLWRADTLKAAPAAVHGLSVEPLLGPLPTLGEYLDGIEWVIVGGESGPRARPMHPAWARSVKDQCQQHGVAFHFKQWGEWDPIARTDGYHEAPFADFDVQTKMWFSKVGKAKAGRLLDGREWNEFPEART